MILGPEYGCDFQDSTCNSNIPSHLALERLGLKNTENIKISSACIFPAWLQPPSIYFSSPQETKALICFSLRRGAGWRTEADCQVALYGKFLLFSQAYSLGLLYSQCQAQGSVHSRISIQFCRICERMDKWMNRWIIYASLGEGRIQSTRGRIHFQEEELVFSAETFLFCRERNNMYSASHTTENQIIGIWCSFKF